jgi:hypothetical protein
MHNMRLPDWAGPAGRVAIALAGAAAFGAVDQHVRLLYSHFATAISFMSAPWLLLPFAVGSFQVRPRHAAWAGLIATWLAVLTYIVVTDVTWDGAHTTALTLAHTAYLQRYYLVGGIVTGPGYGYLGYRWRTERSWLSAGLAAIPVMAEPLAAALGLERGSYGPASYAEALAGLLLGLVFAAMIVWSRPPFGRKPSGGGSGPSRAAGSG